MAAIPDRILSPAAILPCVVAVLLLGLVRAYDIAKIYRYSYQTSMLINEVDSMRSSPAQEDVGFQIRAKINIAPVFQEKTFQLLKLEISVIEAESISKSAFQKNVNSLKTYPVYFELKKDEVGRLYFAETESVFRMNIKKGIISLFQFQLTEGTRSELDVSGDCTMSYAAVGPRIIKTKEKCINMEIAGEHSNINQPLKEIMEVADAAYKQYIILEVLNMSASTYMSGNFIPYCQEMKFISIAVGEDQLEIPDITQIENFLEKKTGYSHTISLLPAAREIQHCVANCVSPLKLVMKHTESLGKEKVGKLESARAFVEILQSFRDVKKDLIAEALTSPDSYNVVTQVIDIASAAQTEEAHGALMELIQFEDEQIDYPERYLFTVAHATDPSEYLIKDLMSFYKKKLPSIKLQESVSLTLGAIIHTYCKINGNFGDKLTETYKQLTIDGLENCEEESCRLMYLRSAGNAGLPSFLPVLLKHASKGKSKMERITAIQSLRRIPRQLVTEQALFMLQNIFFQHSRRYDTSTRAAALETILRSSPSLSVVENILLSITAQRKREFSTYVLAQLLDLANFDDGLRQTVKKAFENPQIRNYDLLSQKGTSSAFTNLLGGSRDVNCTYGLYIENANGALLKRSSMNVALNDKDFSQPLLSFGLYADKLAELISKSDISSADVTAGMSLTILDVLLRPIEFFRGSSELFSAAWNAPTDPVSAQHGNLLLQDHLRVVFLSNGMPLEFKVMGAVSIDISGSVSISFWSQNSHSVVKNSGALFIQGSLKIASNELMAGLLFSAGGSGYIDFITDAEFAEVPIRSCLRMQRPEVEFRHNVTKYERVKGKSFAPKIFRTSKVPESSYFLNKHTSQLCKMMLE